MDRFEVDMSDYQEYVDYSRISDISIGVLRSRIAEEKRHVNLLAQCGVRPRRPHVDVNIVEAYIQQAGGPRDV